MVVCLAGVLAAALLGGCSLASGNTASKDRTSDTDIFSENTVKLIDVSVDNRRSTEVHISTCPQAASVGSGSCGVNWGQ